MPGRRCPFSLETDFRAASFNPPHRTRVRQGMLRCRIRPRCCVSHLPSVHGDDVVHLVGALARTLGVEGVVETRLVERGDLGLHSSTQQHRHVRKTGHKFTVCAAPHTAPTHPRPLFPGKTAASQIVCSAPAQASRAGAHSTRYTALFALLARQDDGGQQQPPLPISEPPDHLAIDTRIQLHPLQIQPTRSIPAPSEPASRWPPSPLAHCPVLKSCATVRAHAHAHGQLTVCARMTLGCARLRNCADGVQAGGQGERRDGGLLTACFEEIGAAAARREKH